MKQFDELPEVSTEEAYERFEAVKERVGMFVIGSVRSRDHAIDLIDSKGFPIYEDDILGTPVNPDADDEYEFNKYELMGYSHEASLILLASDAFGEAMQSVCEQLTRAFNPFVTLMSEYWDDLRTIDFRVCDDRHFDGVYSKPKMFEYYKNRPTALNLNSRIRKVRNLL